MLTSNHRTLSTAIATLVAATVVALSLAGCASSQIKPEPVPSPGPPNPGTTTATVHGHALDADGSPVQGIEIALCAAANCKATEKVAMTASDGSYSIQLPFGTYFAVCAGATTCQIAGSPPKDSVKFALARSGVVVDLVTAAPKKDPPTPATSDTMSGVVYDSAGHPVPGVGVEFRMTACKDCLPQPQTTSDSQGRYAIELNDGYYSAECDVENTDYECGPRGGNGEPFPVTMPTSGHLNFVVCPYQQYPACLGSSAVPTN
jgi:hypothetical protein